ncbi:uncharacterized protein LOC129919224 [Episyrphus balteatus]|uniref:uncharacterized protein LOC129919224 n=1 Tax=Episyrphus balteatus TaxID=286459 RepID=UPI0024858D86|nr:uncharacterized protein LOC129919224 [Episyrphus balteatus]
MYSCDKCQKTFTRRDNYVRHMKINHENKLSVLCDVCGMIFDNTRNYQYHMKKYHQMIVPYNMMSNKRKSSDSDIQVKRIKIENDLNNELKHCTYCRMDIKKSMFQGHLNSNLHKSNASNKHLDNVEVICTAFKSRIKSYRIRDCDRHIDYKDFMKKQECTILGLITEVLQAQNVLKVNFEMFGLYVKDNSDETVTDTKSFNTKNEVINQSTDLRKSYRKFTEDITSKSEEFQERDSGWALQEVLYLEININKYNPMRGASYIELPRNIQLKHAIINVKNNDDACFAWAIVSALYPCQDNADRVSSYPHYSKVLNLNGMEFPMSLKNISKFEKLNNLSVNVYGLENNVLVGPLFYTSEKKEKHVNLLYLENGENGHYCWIKNLNRLVSSQISKRNGALWLCDGCLMYFWSEDRLNEHLKHDCNKVHTILPTEMDNCLKFKSFNKKMRVPFVIYADFEAALKPFDTCLPNPLKSFSNNIQMHEPFSFAYYIKCNYDDSLSKFVLYRGDECTENFMNNLKEDAQRISSILKKEIPMKTLTKEQDTDFINAKKCFICGDNLNENRVRDHDHLTGQFRGAAHSECNLKYQIPDFIPVILHNLSGYDSHFIVKEFGDSDEKIDVIPTNKERYISFTKYIKTGINNSSIQLRFIDSLRFMASSIDKLSKNLNRNQFIETKKAFQKDEEFNLVMKKGVFPYEYVSSAEKLKDTKLPPKSAFYSTLNSSSITDEDYLHAQIVWNTFNMKTLGEYSDVYLKTDVMLLADIFENFRNVCIKTYDLDPCQYYTAPGLSWDAMLKSTKVELELFTDIDMIHFIQKGIRGGLSQCTGRYAKANNKYMSNFDESKKSTFLGYFDVNNLYGWAMSQYLPINNFRWLSDEELKCLNIESIVDNSNKGYILCVDLDYPDYLHDLHNDLPFCPENLKPPYKNSKNTKLIANEFDKTRYVIHYRNLKQCLANGLILKKVHKVLEFNQSAWLKSYIDLNTQLRTLSTNDFEKDFYKLMNNSVFGKTMENVDKRVDVKLITKWDSVGKRLGANSLISKPNFHSRSIIHEDLVVIQMNRLKLEALQQQQLPFVVFDENALIYVAR